MPGFGGSPWGSGAWGGPLSLEGAPLIIPLSPVDGAAGVGQSAPVALRFTDDVGVDPATISIIIGGTSWVVGGVAIGGAIMASSANAFNGFDISLQLPEPFANASTQEVQVFVANITAQVASLVYVFYVGAALRLLQVQNPFSNTLLAYFNRPLQLNVNYYLLTNWTVTPLTATEPLVLTEVLARSGRLDIGQLRYAGGGAGTYRLTVRNLIATDESEIEFGYDYADFELRFPAEADPRIRLFDSIFGPLGISQQLLQRRTIDGHVVDRALAASLNEQLRIRMQRLDTTASPASKPGRRRL
ncbi:MAG: hypothetical protein EPN91_02795 [Salinibacterium sp.]|nr:MAG: hypothetical protein EPN91_02795 [Salinibacterium sp.]